MNGCTIPNTPIAVDFWKVRECPQARLFFLTHLHGDHIAGLTSSWYHPIYCSEITARLLKHKYELKDELIKVLEVGTASIVYLDRDNKEQMTVTALDANHCPGAVMFLFEGYFGRILHTGDFRFKSEMLKQPPLSNLAGKIDTLYLDNTYCSPKCVFPDRDEATKEIIRIVQSHPNHDVVICMRSLGKEDLLQEIALQCKTWISVPSSYYKTLSLIEAKNVFKNSCEECRVRIVPFHMMSNRFVTRLNECTPTIVIIPTALYVGIDAEPYCNQDNVAVVPYSDHSSYTELQKFVSFLKPCSIIPIVKSKTRGPFGVCLADRSDMSCFNQFIGKHSKTEICIPASVKSFMTSNRANPLNFAKPGRGQVKKMKARRPNERGIVYLSPSKDCTPTADSNVHPNSMTYKAINRGKSTETVVAKHSRVSDNSVIGSTNLILDEHCDKGEIEDEHTERRSVMNHCYKSLKGTKRQKEKINCAEMNGCKIMDVSLKNVHHPSSLRDKRVNIGRELDKSINMVVESQGFIVEIESDFSDNDKENLEIIQTSSEISVDKICADDYSGMHTSALNKDLKEESRSKATSSLTNIEHMDWSNEKSLIIANTGVISGPLNQNNIGQSMNIHDVHFGSKNACLENSGNDESIESTQVSCSNEIIISDSSSDVDYAIPKAPDGNKLLAEMFGDSDISFTLDTLSQTSEHDNLERFVPDLTNTRDEIVLDHDLPDDALDNTNGRKDRYQQGAKEASANKTQNLPKQDHLCRLFMGGRKSETMNIIDLYIDKLNKSDAVSFDLTRFNVVPVSASRKSSRRCRLYRNLLTGISRMSPVL